MPKISSYPGIKCTNEVWMSWFTYMGSLERLIRPFPTSTTLSGNSEAAQTLSVSVCLSRHTSHGRHESWAKFVFPNQTAKQQLSVARGSDVERADSTPISIRLGPTWLELDHFDSFITTSSSRRGQLRTWTDLHSRCSVANQLLEPELFVA